jgi:hypothetical protein
MKPVDNKQAERVGQNVQSPNVRRWRYISMLSFPCNVKHKHDSQDHSSRIAPDSPVGGAGRLQHGGDEPFRRHRQQQAHLITVSVVLMLLIIVPVMIPGRVFRP